MKEKEIKEINKLRIKAKAWDDIYREVDKLYSDESDADLADVGEIVADMLGFL